MCMYVYMCVYIKGVLEIENNKRILILEHLLKHFCIFLLYILSLFFIYIFLLSHKSNTNYREKIMII